MSEAGQRQRVRAVHLGDRGPGGVVVEAATLAAAVAVEGPLPPGRPRNREDLAQRLALGGPRGVAVDPLRHRVAGLLVEGVHAGPVGGCEGGVLGDQLGPQVHRVDEAARRREVRRGLHRRDRLGGVQRVDEHVVGAVGHRRPGAEVGQVGQVAGAPRAGRADAVELGGQTPARLVAEPGGRADPVRRDDQAHPRERGRRTARAPSGSRAAGRRGPRTSPRRPARARRCVAGSSSPAARRRRGARRSRARPRRRRPSRPGRARRTSAASPAGSPAPVAASAPTPRPPSRPARPARPRPCPRRRRARGARPPSSSVATATCRPCQSQ